MMELRQVFSPRRFGRLLIADLHAGSRGMLVTAGAILGVLLLINVVSVGSAERWDFHRVFFPLTLLVGGHVATSLAFTALHDKTLGYRYLTQPGSSLEKFTVKLVLTAAGWPILALIAYEAFSFLAAGLTTALFGRAHALFDPTDAEVWTTLRLYLATQAVTLYGAVRFRKLALIKTSLAAAALGLALLIAGVATARIVFGPYFGALPVGEGWGGVIGWDVAGGTGRVVEIASIAGRIAWFAFWWLMAPFFWVAACLRLAETELR
jgi:hypothetical protein